MNRSFQSIAALLVSLSGAMLAVTWIPAEGPRRPPFGQADRRRAASVPCGYATSGELVAARQVTAHHRPEVELANSNGVGSGQAASTSALPEELIRLPYGEPWLADWGAAAPTWSATIADSPAARAVAAAFGQSLRPLWPVGDRVASLGDRHVRDKERRRIETKYAAAELAASRPTASSLMSAVMEQGVTLVGDALEALDSRRWPLISKYIADKLTMKYEEVIAHYGWEETIRPLTMHIRRQHDRLAQREALLREMDRRFLEVPVDTKARTPEKPPFRPQNRKLMLAAADALKSLSHALNAAAEQLEAASRQDVAELHTPVENREEKR